MQFDRRLVLVLLLAGGTALILAGRFLPKPRRPPADLAPASRSARARRWPRRSRRAGPSSSTSSVRSATRASTGCPRAAARATPCGARAAPRPRADLASVNLAALLADGEQVRVPRSSRRARPGAGASASGPPAIVHLNGASADDLDALDGIGPALAARIVAYRIAHGGFRSVDELDEVSGIGPARLEALRARLAL